MSYQGRGPRSSLELGPGYVYPVKAALTRARSILWAARSGSSLTAHGLRILFYHRISDDRDELAVAPRRFREQMAFLAAEGAHVIDVVEAWNQLTAGALDPQAIALSFEDGYLDVRDEVLPVLAEQGFRATVFVATGLLDGTASMTWYSRQPSLLSWDDVVALDCGGTLRFEAHSVTHPNLIRLSAQAAEDEIIGAKRTLEARLRRPIEAFAYPGGVFSERERRLVENAGYRIALTCEPGVNGKGTDPFALRRVQIDARDGLLDFRAKVAGAHDRSLPFRAAYRRHRYGSLTSRKGDAMTTDTRGLVQREKDFWTEQATEESFGRARRWIRRSLGEFRRHEEIHNYYDPRGKVVLDYGCAEGELTFDLLERGAKRVVGFDICEPFIEEARRRAAERGVEDRTEFMVADAHRTGLPDATFDLIIGIAILHHLDLATALTELRRLLKPGGKAVFVEPLWHNPILRVGRALTPRGRTPDEHPLTEDDWKLCQTIFPDFDHHEREFVTLFFMPLNFAMPHRAQMWIARHLSALDDRVIPAFPRVRKYARLSILELPR